MTQNSTRASAALILTAAALDVASVLLFAVIGRNSHAEAWSLSGLWQTAWPFLAGLVIAWGVAAVWLTPTAVLRSGVPVWLGTVLIGMILRVLFTPGGAAPAFVVVASVALGTLLLGWRGITALLRRRRRN